MTTSSMTMDRENRASQNNRQKSRRENKADQVSKIAMSTDEAWLQIEAGAAKFMQMRDSKIRQNIHCSVVGFDLVAELYFIDYLIYYSLFDILERFIGPKNGIGEAENLSPKEKGFERAEEKSEEVENDGWEKVQRRKKGGHRKKRSIHLPRTSASRRKES